MQQFSLRTLFFIAIIYACFAARSAWAISPNPKLLSLVPTQARILSGMRAFPEGKQESRFLLMTSNSERDMVDLMALAGADSKLSMQEVILEASPDENGLLCKHSLLVSGSFDRERIYKSAISNGATMIQYHGLDVLVIEPFLRERDVFQETRWLAILDGNITLFGTKQNVGEELDRYLRHSAAEAVFVRQLDRLKKNNETWSMLLTVNDDPEMAIALKTMETVLPRPILIGGSLEFSIHFGSHIEFEYDMSAPPEAESGAQARVWLPPRHFSETAIRESAFWAPPLNDQSDGSHGTVKFSRERYSAWLAELRAQGLIVTKQ